MSCKYKPKPTLGRWVTSQRSMYKRGTLPADYIQKLDAIGFTWDMYSKTLVSLKFFPSTQHYANESSSLHRCEDHSPVAEIASSNYIKIPIMHNKSHAKGITVLQNNDNPNKRRRRHETIGEQYADNLIVVNNNNCHKENKHDENVKKDYMSAAIKKEEKDHRDSIVREISSDEDSDMLKTRSSRSRSYRNKDIKV
jgi:Helicase associated domain